MMNRTDIPASHADIQKYGTRLRIFDAGPKELERYTILPHQHDKGRLIRGVAWSAVAASEHGRQFYHIEVPAHAPNAHLGRRIGIDGLSAELVNKLKSEYPDYFES